MVEKTRYFKIGLFVITAVTIAVFSVLILGAKFLFKKKLLVETYFAESVYGLDVGSPVKFRGFRIGSIEEIALAGKEYLTDKRYIMARSSLYPDPIRLKTGAVVESSIKEEVEKGLRARLGFQGLTGTAHLELDYVALDHEDAMQIDWQPKYTYIPSVPSTITRVGVAVDSIMKSLEEMNIQGLAEDLKKSLNLITKVVEDTKLRKMAEDLNNSLNLVSKTLAGVDAKKISEQAVGLIAEIRETNRRLDQLLKEPETKSILTDASLTLAAARRILEKSEKPVSQLIMSLKRASESMDTLTGKIDALSEDVPESLVHLKKTVIRLHHLISGQQQDIEDAIKNIRLISENVRELTENAKKYPSQLLFGEPPPPSKTGER